MRLLVVPNYFLDKKHIFEDKCTKAIQHKSIIYSCVRASLVSDMINYHRIVDYDYDGRKNVGPMQSVTIPVGKDMSYTGSNPVQIGHLLLSSGSTSVHSVQIPSLEWQCR